MATTKPEKRSLELPSDLVQRVERRLSRTEWETPEEYVTHILEEVLFRVEEQTGDEPFQGVDEAVVEDRLQSLGYVEE